MTTAEPPPVLELGDARCADPAVAGMIAAAIARAAGAGLPTPPGFVLTSASFDPSDPAWSHGSPPPEMTAALRAAWEGLAGDSSPLVVRPSPVVDDLGASSTEPLRTVRDVVGWDAFLDAVREVMAAGPTAPGGEAVAPAVLAQRQIEAAVGGIAFGIDPITGDPRHYVLEAVAGGPERLVSGTVTAQRYVVGHRGRVVQSQSDDRDGAASLDSSALRAVARPVHRAGQVFGRPQDVEWAFDHDGMLWLLQSRPVGAVGGGAETSGPLLGPGPVGETFPDPLRRLESDLWIVPLREGIRRALTLTGVVSRRRLASSPVVDLVDGRVAADLDLFGYTPGRRSGWRILDPRPGARRLLAAWRIGQIRNVLAEQIAGVLARCDGDLAAVPPLSTLEDAQLLGLVDRCREHLMAVHGHEVMAGTLLPPDEDAPSAAAVALAALAAGRARGLDDATIIAVSPAVLALVPPRIGGSRALPQVDADTAARRSGWSPERPAELDDLGSRDALRLRARWLHELSARAVEELGVRAAAAGTLSRPADIVYLGVDELPALVAGSVPADLTERSGWRPGPPLPAAFRRGSEGFVAPVRRRGDHRPGGRGAGGGRGEGIVCASEEAVEPGDVLIVRTLSPRLAPYLPTLGGLVAETGSVLSHVAILAREYGVPTVVAVHDAMHRYPPGTRLLVDGDTGEITVLAAATTDADADAKGGDGHEEAAWAG